MPTTKANAASANQPTAPTPGSPAAATAAAPAAPATAEPAPPVAADTASAAPKAAAKPIAATRRRRPSGLTDKGLSALAPPALPAAAGGGGRKSAAPAQVASPGTKQPAAKAVGKVADKTASKPVGKAAEPEAKKPQGRGKAGRAEKAPKLHRKPVRDSFTMPEADFSLIALLKARTLAAGRATKKSELLRAGLQALAALPVAALVASLERLEPIKIGRPAGKTGN